VHACADSRTGGSATDNFAQPEPLGPPDAVFPEDFGYVHTAVELPDGQVLVADPLGKALYRVDMDDGTRSTPMWAPPRAPPPLSTSATFGLCSANEGNAQNMTRAQHRNGTLLKSGPRVIL